MAAARKRHLRRAVPSDAGNGICELRVKKTLVNSQNLPLLPQQNFKRLATLATSPNAPYTPLTSPKYGYFLKRSFPVEEGIEILAGAIS